MTSSEDRVAEKRQAAWTKYTSGIMYNNRVLAPGHAVGRPLPISSANGILLNKCNEIPYPEALIAFIPKELSDLEHENHAEVEAILICQPHARSFHVTNPWRPLLNEMKTKMREHFNDMAWAESSMAGMTESAKCVRPPVLPAVCQQQFAERRRAVLDKIWDTLTTPAREAFWLNHHQFVGQLSQIKAFNDILDAARVWEAREPLVR